MTREDEVDDSAVPALQSPELAHLISRGRVVVEKSSVTLDLSDPSAWLEREFRGPWLAYLRKHRRLFLKDHPSLKASDIPVLDRMIEFEYYADVCGSFMRAGGLRLGNDYPVIAKMQQDFAGRARVLRSDLLGSPKSRRQPAAPSLQVGIPMYATVVREARQRLSAPKRELTVIEGEIHGAGKPVLEGR